MSLRNKTIATSKWWLLLVFSSSRQTSLCVCVCVCVTEWELMVRESLSKQSLSLSLSLCVHTETLGATHSPWTVTRVCHERKSVLCKDTFQRICWCSRLLPCSIHFFRPRYQVLLFTRTCETTPMGDYWLMARMRRVRVPIFLKSVSFPLEGFEVSLPRTQLVMI